MLSLPSSPRVRRIVLAYTVNRLGTWFGVVALSLAVFDQTHSALAVAALLVAAQVIPAFLVPAMVARVEASPRGGELSALYVFEGAVTIALALLVGHFWLPIMLLLVALDGTAALTANALLRTEAARAARDELVAAPSGAGVDQDEGSRVQAAEQRANAALNLAFSATFVLGPAAAGALVAGAGAATALFIDAGSFLVCGALLTDLRPHIEEAGGESVAARLRTAWRFINDVPALRALLLIQGAALIFFESAGPIEVAYAKATLHAGDGGYGLLMATWGVGVVVGGIVFARAASDSLVAMLSAGTLAVGLAYVGFSLAPTLALAAVAAVVGGVGNGVQWAPVISSVQRLTPPGLQGRVMGALESIGALTPAIGLSLGGVLVALTTPRIAFLVVGVGAAVTTIGFARLPLGGGHESAPDAAGSEQRTARAQAGDQPTRRDEHVAS